MPALALQLYVFFYNIYILLDLLPLLLYFFLFTILKCFHTMDVRLLVLGFFPKGSGWGMLEGWLEEGALVGVG